MAQYKLTPTADRLNDPAWAYSTEHRPCYVGADSEREARELAALEFVTAAPVTSPDKIPAGLPWLSPHLTVCSPIAELGSDRMPHGYVYVVE